MSLAVKKTLLSGEESCRATQQRDSPTTTKSRVQRKTQKSVTARSVHAFLGSVCLVWVKTGRKLIPSDPSAKSFRAMSGNRKAMTSASIIPPLDIPKAAAVATSRKSPRIRLKNVPMTRIIVPLKILFRNLIFHNKIGQTHKAFRISMIPSLYYKFKTVSQFNRYYRRGNISNPIPIY